MSFFRRLVHDVGKIAKPIVKYGIEKPILGPTQYALKHPGQTAALVGALTGNPALIAGGVGADLHPGTGYFPTDTGGVSLGNIAKTVEDYFLAKSQQGASSAAAAPPVNVNVDVGDIGNTVASPPDFSSGAYALASEVGRQVHIRPVQSAVDKLRTSSDAFFRSQGFPVSGGVIGGFGGTLAVARGAGGAAGLRQLGRTMMKSPSVPFKIAGGALVVGAPYVAGLGAWFKSNAKDTAKAARQAAADAEKARQQQVQGRMDFAKFQLARFKARQDAPLEAKRRAIAELKADLELKKLTGGGGHRRPNLSWLQEISVPSEGQRKLQLANIEARYQAHTAGARRYAAEIAAQKMREAAYQQRLATKIAGRQGLFDKYATPLLMGFLSPRPRRARAAAVRVSVPSVPRPAATARLSARKPKRKKRTKHKSRRHRRKAHKPKRLFA